MKTTHGIDLYAPDPARRWATLAALSLMLGWLLAGCGDVTATMVPPAAAEPNERGVIAAPEVTTDATYAPDGAPAETAAADGGTESAQSADVVTPGADVAAPDLAVAPEHPALHCAGGEYRTAACKPGCGTCAKVGEASTFATGCWLPDDFHCVASCTECR